MEPTDYWVVVARSCSECGDSIATRLLSHEPTEAESKEVSRVLGGMFCIKVAVTTNHMDGEAVFHEGPRC